MVKSLRTRRGLAFLLALLWLLPAVLIHPKNVSASTSTYYVSVDGSDSAGDGSLANPWRTIQKAANVMTAGDVCIIRGGVYRETVVPVQSGIEGAPLTFRSYPGETVTISGAELLSGWTEDSEAPGRLYKASMPWSLGSGNQVFINGTMAGEARWPNNTGSLLEPTLAEMTAGSNTTLTDSRIPTGVDWVGGTAWFAGGAAWVGQDSTITGFNPATGVMTFASVRASNSNYDAQIGNTYYLSGVKGALDVDREWWYDGAAQQLVLQPPGGSAVSSLLVEAKKRLFGFDVSGKSYMVIEGVDLFAAGIKTSDTTHHVRIDGMKASYVSHNTRNPQSNPAADNNGITLRGEANEIVNSELAYSSGSLLDVKGQNHRIVNNYLHDGNYAGTWNGLISAEGKGHYIAYNTLTRSGRDVMKLDNLEQMIVERNDLSYGGLVTKDSGLIYTAGDDARQSEIRYNTLHDMYTHLGMGIYTDNQSTNYIIHHNVLWNIPNSDPIRLNSPSNYNLVFNNTAGTNTKGMATWAIVYRGDMFGDRVFNNIFAGGDIDFGESRGYAQSHNLLAGLDPLFEHAAQHDFRLQASSPAINAGRVIPGITDGYAGTAPDLGAYEYGQPLFKTGHDFAQPPVIGAVVQQAPPYVNLVRNNGFESGDLQSWTVTGGKVKAIYSPGGAWSSEMAAMRIQSGGVQLKSAGSELTQTVTGLQPNTRYTFSLWTKTSADQALASFGVRDYGGPTVNRQVYGTGWKQHTLDFTTGISDTSATVYLGQAGAGSGGSEIVELDTRTMEGTANAWLEYDVTSFIQAQAADDRVATLNMKGALSRTTFALKRSGVNQPKLVVKLAGTATLVELAATDSAGVRLRTGTTEAETTHANPTSFNAANWNSGYQEEFYLKFPLDQLAGSTITEAKLKLLANGVAAAGAKSTVYGLADDSWTESTLTWNNKPQAVEQIVSYDDIGVILPLDDQSAGDALRALILDARMLHARASTAGEFSSAVLADFAAGIDEARQTADDPAATPAQLNAALEQLKAKEESLQARRALLGAIQAAQLLVQQTKAGTLPGQYAAGDRSELQQAVTLAQASFNDADPDKTALAAVMQQLDTAANLYDARVVATPVDDLPKLRLDAILGHPQGWSESYGSVSGGWSRFSKDYTRYTAAPYGSGLFVLDLKYSFLQVASEWPGILLRSQKPAGPLNQDTTYIVIFKEGVWELQKWVGGKQTLFNTYPNTRFDGTATPVYVGAVNVEDGVRLLLYVNGQPVFDWIDRQAPIYQSGYFGFVSAGQSGDIDAKPLHRPELALTGPSSVQAGAQLDLSLRASGVADTLQESVSGAVYGGQAAIRFDPARFDFVGATASHGSTLLQVIPGTEPGTLTLQWSDASGVRLDEGEAFVGLAFEAKTTEGFGGFELSNAELRDAASAAIAAIPLSLRVEVKSGTP
ncbi:DNRLRE domain-containing protein [Paenibacillus hodogayensis]|uniref:DNRLRE domain-containing protein n=1 Tax=Paenibacillus hodogayensis TaxID=279208 RepID=A0ABV5W635_9BACL